ncbi:unnamed protein product [Rhizoctonia solani]|uniref:Uncharacterized protein n=1 Tax=Rhizoctonia solani TaxID=456999 RepID=A0A8H3AVD5_9AGAM|nr:unnamed protein product [Rhizoctonia solani]
MPGQDEFQSQLSQWLLNQLNSRAELATVTQQFNLLISQAQEQSLGDLYAHVGKLIFQKAAQIKPESPRISIWLCAELCYSLFVAHCRQRSSLSPITLIHEHIFRLCIDSLSAENIKEPVNTTEPGNGNEISVEKNSELLFHLWDFQLISLAQICEYMFRVIEVHKSSVGHRLSDAEVGVHFLLHSCFPDYSHGPWKRETDLFCGWIDAQSGSNENQADSITDGTSQSGEEYAFTSSEDATINHWGMSLVPTWQPLVSGGLVPSLDAFSSSDTIEFSPGSTNGPISYDKVACLAQGKDHGEEEERKAAENNTGKPPQTPVTSEFEFLADAISEKQVPVGVAGVTEHRPTSSVIFGSIGTAQPSANGAKFVAPTPTHPAAAITAPATVVASMAASTAPPTAAPPTDSIPTKIDIHALFQGGGIPTGVTTSLANTSGIPHMSANTPLVHQYQHPMVHPHQHYAPHPGYPIQPSPQWGPSGYYYPPPHDYTPYAMHWGGPPQHQHPYMPQIHEPPLQSSPRTQPAEARPASAPPISNIGSPHPLPATTTTSLQAPPSSPSPSLSVDSPTFVPGGLRRNHCPDEATQKEDGLQAEEAGHKIKEAEEHGAREGKEGKQEERRAKRQAERKAKKEAKRKAREEEERKGAEQKAKQEAEYRAKEERKAIETAEAAARAEASRKTELKVKADIIDTRGKKINPPSNPAKSVKAAQSNTSSSSIPLASSAWSKGPPEPLLPRWTGVVVTEQQSSEWLAKKRMEKAMSEASKEWMDSVRKACRAKHS